MWLAIPLSIFLLFLVKIYDNVWCGYLAITLFTQMWDNSNLRRPPRNNTCAKKNILLLTAYTLYMKCVSDTIYLYQSVSLSPSP